MSQPQSNSVDYERKSIGVGENQVFLHRDCMQWKAVYLEGKYFIADPNSVNKLLQIQAEIQLQRRLAQADSSEEDKAESFHSYYDKIDLANYSYATQSNPQAQKLNSIKVQQELHKEEDLYAQRILEARNKKKQKKKGNKNLIKIVNDKQDFKSAKLQKEEKDNEQVLQKSMLKVQQKKQTLDLQQKLPKNVQKQKNQRNPYDKHEFVKEQKEQNVKLQQNSTILIHIIESPEKPKPQQQQPVQMEASEAQEFKLFKQEIKVDADQHSILSLNSSAQKRIDHQVNNERVGDQFFYQLHSKIDELQQNIGQIKSEKPQENRILSPPPMVEPTLSPKFKQSKVMIDTKNMLKDLNHQLKEIGLVDPQQDSHITSVYIDNLKGTKQQESNQKVIDNNQPIINQEIMLNNMPNPNPKKQNKSLYVQEAFNIVCSPAAKQKVQQIQEKPIKKPQNCKIISSLLSHQIAQASPIIPQKGVTQERQKLNEEITLLKQVIGQLRVQRIKYQTSNHDKLLDTPNSLSNKRQQEVDKEQISNRINGSILNNFTQSSVSQIHSNQYRSAITKRGISGKIVKNKSPIKMAKIEEQKINETIFQRQITKNELQVQSKESSIKQQEKSKESLQVNMQEAQSIKITTEQVSRNMDKQQNSANNIGILKNQAKEIYPKFTKKDNLVGNNNSKAYELQMQSSMPRPLNKHNRSQPPKFIIEQHDNHRKKYQSSMKRKLINDFEKFQVDSKAKYNTVSQQKMDPKRRANKQGVLKTIQSKPAVFHPDLNKVVLKKDQVNLKAKIIEEHKSRPQKIGIKLNTNGNESQKSKGFRLRRESQASRQSRASKDAKLSARGTNKQQNNKLYVPALGSFGHEQQLKNESYSEVKIEKQEFTDSKVSFKIEKRKINFNYLEVPKFPQTPSINIKIEEMGELIKKMNSILNLQLKEGELNKLIMKKYKNCIMLDLPNPQHLKLVWHYNGKIYIGQWNQPAMLKQGEGLEYMPQKYYYKGQFQSGKRQGYGIMVQQSGNIYQGQWEQGEKSGRGKYYDAAIKLNYEGQWKNGKRQGIGYLSIQNQSNYEGFFVENYKDGFGTQSFSNGDSYKGQYSKGRFHGKGIYVWNEGDVYQGQFVEGCKHGNGVWTSFIGEIFEGQYKNDKKCGSGKYRWGNGCVFEGEFDNDKKNGVGVLTYPDGREVKGRWRQGKLIEQFSSRRDDKEDPLTHRKSKVIESVTYVKANSKDQKQKK